MATTTTLINSPSFGRCIFDVVFQVGHSNPVTITQHPVQMGSPVADHAFQEPEEVTLEIGMSDVYSSLDTIAGGARNRSATAYKMLVQLMRRMEPVSLTTRIRTYPSMLISSIETSDDFRTMHALKVTISLTSIRIVQVATMSIQQTASSTKIQYQTLEEQMGSSGWAGSSISGCPICYPFDMISPVSSNSYTGRTNTGQVQSQVTTVSTSVLSDLYRKIMGG